MSSDHKSYYVFIVGEDQNGAEVMFNEIADYPELPNIAECGVPEHERESRAIGQVQRRMPHLRNVRANGSRHIDFGPYSL